MQDIARLPLEGAGSSVIELKDLARLAAAAGPGA